MADERSISGTYRYRDVLCFIVLDPDGMRCAFTENGETADPESLLKDGERLSGEVPEWVLEIAKVARNVWDAQGEQRMIDDRGRRAFNAGGHRPLSEMPIITYSPRPKVADPSRK